MSDTLSNPPMITLMTLLDRFRLRILQFASVTGRKKMSDVSLNKFMVTMYLPLWWISSLIMNFKKHTLCPSCCIASQFLHPSSYKEQRIGKSCSLFPCILEICYCQTCSLNWHTRIVEKTAIFICQLWLHKIAQVKFRKICNCDRKQNIDGAIFNPQNIRLQAMYTIPVGELYCLGPNT